MVVVDHHRVKVHRTLAPIVERILLDLASNGLTAETTGWAPGQDGRRVKIAVDGFTPERAAAAMLAYGFEPTGEDSWFMWGSDIPPEDSEAPREPQKREDSPKQTQITKPAVLTPTQGDQKLGSRPLGLGDQGADVLTLQAFLGAPRTGLYDEVTAETVRLFHTRKGSTSDGSMPLASQAWIIPRTVERLRTGAAGLTVMLLTAALIGKRVLDLDTPLEPRYTVALANTVRSYRESIGLPRSEVVDHPTWASLVEQPRR
jgi:hypothetical protein